MSQTTGARGPSRRSFVGGVLALGAGGLLAGCASGTTGGSTSTPVVSLPATGTASPSPTGTATASRTPGPASSSASPAPDLEAIAGRYQQLAPTQWGLETSGVVLRSDARSIALTLDACGGPSGSGVDTDLIDFLRAEQIPATLFLNSRWIQTNRSVVDELAGDTLFELANHGTRHLPLSVNGRKAYGIQGTRSVAEALDEVFENHESMARITGVAPRFFRSGTAHYDDVAAQLVREFGEIPVNFDVNGDGGATFSTGQVKAAVGTARPGSIIIAHMNQPNGATAEGLAAALAQLRSQGHVFAHLGDVGLR